MATIRKEIVLDVPPAKVSNPWKTEHEYPRLSRVSLRIVICPACWKGGLEGLEGDLEGLEGGLEEGEDPKELLVQFA